MIADKLEPDSCMVLSNGLALKCGRKVASRELTQNFLFVLWLLVGCGGFVHSIEAHGVNLIFWLWSVGERSLPGSWNFPLCPMVTWEVVVVSSTPLGHMELTNRTSSVGYVFIIDWICSTVHGLYYWSMWLVLTWFPSKIGKPPSRKILSF